MTEPRGLLLAFVIVLAGCGAASTGSEPRSPDVMSSKVPFDTRELRQPAVFVRVELGRGQFQDREAAALPSEYENLLLEGLNTRAVISRDLTVVPSKTPLDHRAAVARAREVGADHALLVDVTVSRVDLSYCRGSRGAFTAPALTVVQRVTVLRASDGAVRWQPRERLETAAIEPDCEKPRESRQRSRTETLQAAVDRLLTELLRGESAR